MDCLIGGDMRPRRVATRAVTTLAEQLRADLRRDRQLLATAYTAGDCPAAQQIVRHRLAETEAALHQLGEVA